MTTVTLGSVCNAIAAVVANTAGVIRVQSYDELTEGMQDWPSIQVYPESAEQSWQSDTDTQTLCGGVQITNLVVHVDLYGAQRSHIAENWGDTIDAASSLHDVLAAEGQCDDDGRCPHFGHEGIKSFRFTWNRVLFRYGTVLYTGVRFILQIRIF